MSKLKIKKCGGCKYELPLKAFSFRNKATKQLSSYCRECQKAATGRHYIANKEDYNARDKARRLTLRQYKYDYLKANPCIHCGESSIEVLEFHHITPKNKISTISSIIRKLGSMAKLKDEIAKTIILCSNCHKRVTAKQHNWYDGLEL